MQDRVLVDRCLAGEADAWGELFAKQQAAVELAVGLLLNPRDRGNSELIEEIAARVWYSVAQDGGRLLGRFDASRGCRLSTFFAAVARHELLEHWRSERRRRKREVTAWQWRAGSNGEPRQPFVFDEFLAELTPRERQFFDQELLGLSQSDSPIAFSPANSWQLRHRVLAKLSRFIGSE